MDDTFNKLKLLAMGSKLDRISRLQNWLLGITQPVTLWIRVVMTPIWTVPSGLENARSLLLKRWQTRIRSRFLETMGQIPRARRASIVIFAEG